MSALVLDSVIHAPIRLQVTAFLAGVSEAEFAALKDAVEVSDSVLSKHLSQLVDAGYVEARKAAIGGRQRTWLSLTRKGRKAFVGYVQTLERLTEAAKRAAE